MPNKAWINTWAAAALGFAADVMLRAVCENNDTLGINSSSRPDCCFPPHPTEHYSLCIVDTQGPLSQRAKEPFR